ncbi:MAG TPA: hypothetical protein VD997_05325 [Phycisphaerales bacterium]|nr:hypothetical protein [Phycisphaerales bacterium]
MMLAVIAAAALAAQNGAPETCSPRSPNYTAQSVHVQSNSSPTYSFPGVGSQQVVNGRVYKGRAIIGQHELGARGPAADAAAAHGALGEEGVRVTAQVEGLFRYHPTTTVEFSPWTPVAQQQASPYSDAYSRAHTKMARRAEEARQQWLKDNNYVGGVRTHVNDAVLYNLPEAKRETRLPEPRGVIEVNPEIPAFKSRMKVQAKPVITLPTVALKSTAPKVLPKDAVIAKKVDEQPKAAAPVVKVAQK